MSVGEKGRFDVRDAGFSCKETAELLGLKSPAKASQAMQPAWEKVARHFRADPARTLKTILAYVDELEPMTEREYDARVAMLEGGRRR